MKSILNTAANLLALAGILLCVGAVAGRAYGATAMVYGFHPSNVVTAGIALMVMACLGKLEAKH